MLRNPKYVYGPMDIQIPAKIHCAEYALEQMYKNREKVAFINGATEESVTYGQILQESMNLAISLSHLGLRKGQTVALCTENRPEFWGVVLGVTCTGAVLTCINPGYMEEELKHVVKISKPVYLFISPNCYKLHGKLFKSQPGIKRIIVFGDQRIDNVTLYNEITRPVTDNDTGDVIVNNRLSRNVRYNEFEVTDVEGQKDVMFILYSSGTTGVPKGVMLTHLNVLGQCLMPIGQPSHYHSLTIVPWFHVFGLIGTLLGITVGRTYVYLQKFQVDLYLRTIEKYKVPQLSLVPAILMAATKSSGQYDLSSVKLIWSGAAPLHKEAEALVKSKFPNIIGVFQGYGMTETSMAVTRFKMPDVEAFGTSKPGSIGRITDGVIIKVVDLETQKPLGPNQTGEICVKGISIMKGYIGKEGKEDFDSEGFFKTGDVGYYDDDRFFFIVDRLKELIKYKGYQVAPAELEGLLLKHDAILDAGVIGVPHRTAGEVPLAFVVRQPGASVTEKEIQEFVAGKLSNPKHLRGGVRFVDAIPKNPSGKILRKTLRLMAKKNTSKL